MSYAYKPSYGANTDQTWQQRRPNTQSSVTDKIYNIISSGDGSGEGLPMYKDKPHNYAASGRRLPFYRRSQRRSLVFLFGVFVWIVWFTGIFSSGDSDDKSAKEGARSWFSGTKVDIWKERREKVKDAFKISWKAYEDHAWGMVIV